jgi:uncharacterized protein YqeY
MTKIEQLDDDIAAAMRAGQSDVTDVLRLLKSSIKNEAIKVGHELSDDEVMKVLAKEAKQRRDSITAYEAAKRADLVQVEQAELVIIETYLPKQLDEAELTKIVVAAIAETGATSKAQMGQVMAAVMKQTAGAADGAVVSRLVAAQLS